MSALAYSAGLVPRGVAELGDAITGLVVGSGIAADQGQVLPIPGVLSHTPRIIVPDVSIAAPIVFPESRDLGVLNMALAQGVVHYPGSALPGEPGTMFLFGHSTGLAVVHNKNFEVFNRLHELGAGDVIRLRYAGREYWYRVLQVETRRADTARVDLALNGPRRLVLSTCRIFGTLDDRFVVTAEFMKSYPLQHPA